MGELRSKLESAIKDAMRSKDKLRLTTLRMVKSAIRYKEIDSKAELGDPDIIQVLATMVKQRTDSIKAFKEGGRDELADKEEQELKMLQEFLPPQMSPEDILIKAKEVIEDVGASGAKDFGKVMKAVMPLVRGMASGKEVTAIVKDLLT